jgi:hypothetical protein
LFKLSFANSCTIYRGSLACACAEGSNIQAKKRFFYQNIRGRLVRCLFCVVIGVSLLSMPVVGYAADSGAMV